MKPKHRKITETFVPSVEQDGKVGPNLSEHIANGSSQITIEYLTSVIEDLKKQVDSLKNTIDAMQQAIDMLTNTLTQP